MTELEALAARLPELKDEGKMERLLSDAADTVLDIIGRDAVPDRLRSVVVELAVIAHNREGTEGEASRGEGGLSAAYIDGLPAVLKQRLLNYPRKVRVMRDALAG